MTDEYTPTLKDIREVWIYAQDITHDEGEAFHGAEFDRWLAEYTRQQREEGWVRGVRDAFHESVEAGDYWTPGDLVNPYRAES